MYPRSYLTIVSPLSPPPCLDQPSPCTRSPCAWQGRRTRQTPAAAAAKPRGGCQVPVCASVYLFEPLYTSLCIFICTIKNLGSIRFNLRQFLVTVFVTAGQWFRSVSVGMSVILRKHFTVKKCPTLITKNCYCLSWHALNLPSATLTYLKLLVGNLVIRRPSLLIRSRIKIGPLQFLIVSIAKFVSSIAKFASSIAGRGCWWTSP